MELPLWVETKMSENNTYIYIWKQGKTKAWIIKEIPSLPPVP